MQLQRNVAFNCVGVVVFQPRASARLQCGWVQWCDVERPVMTEQASFCVCLPTRITLPWLAGRPQYGYRVGGWWRGVKESKQTRDSFTQTPVFLSRYVLVFKLYCICVLLWYVLYVPCGGEHMRLPVTALHRL